MKTIRRKFNIFEMMELEILKNTEKGPVESFVLTPDEFEEFRSDAKNHRTSFKKISGRTDDDIGGDWTYKGALVQISGKIKS